MCVCSQAVCRSDARVQAVVCLPRTVFYARGVVAVRCGVAARAMCACVACTNGQWQLTHNDARRGGGGGGGARRRGHHNARPPCHQCASQNTLRYGRLQFTPTGCNKRVFRHVWGCGYQPQAVKGPGHPPCPTYPASEYPPFTASWAGNRQWRVVFQPPRRQG